MARKSAQPQTVLHADGTTRFIRHRTVEVDMNRATTTLASVAAYWQELAAIYPGDAQVSDATSHEIAAFWIEYKSPETDSEYAIRVADEQRREQLRIAEQNAARDKAIQRRARRDRPLTQKQELDLLAVLKAKYPEA